MWNQSSGGSIGSLLQNLAQNNPQVFQAIMQMVSAQRQQGVGGIGSLMPRAGASPRGDNSMIGGPMPMGGNLAMQVPPGGMPRAAAPPSYSGQPPQGGMWGMSGPMPMPAPAYRRGPGGTTLDTLPPPQMGGGPSAPFDPNAAWRQATNWMQPSGGASVPSMGGNMRMGSAPYSPQPTGPKYMPPTGPKTYGQTMPAEAPPSFAQPKPFPQPAAQPSLAGNGTTGLDWYAMQAGN